MSEENVGQLNQLFLIVDQHNQMISLQASEALALKTEQPDWEQLFDADDRQAVLGFLNPPPQPGQVLRGLRLKSEATKNLEPGYYAVTLNYLGAFQNQQHLLLSCQWTPQISEASSLLPLEQKFRLLFEHNQVGFAIWHGEQLVDCNAFYEQLCGVPKAQLQSMVYWDLSLPEQKAKQQALYREIEAGQREAYRLEQALIRADKSQIWVALLVQAVRGQSGQPPFLVMVLKDITKQKEAQQALILQEERMRLAFEASEDGFWDWNIEADYVYYSPRWCRMLGYKSREILPQFYSWESLVHPKDVGQMWDEINRVLSGQKPQLHVEFRMRHQAGHWVDMLARGVPIKTKNREVKRLVGSHMNLSRQKEQAQALVESQINLEAVVTSLKDLVFLMDRHFVYRQVWTNDANMLFAAPEDLIGKSLSEVLPEAFAQQVQGVMEKAYQSGRIQTLEYPHIHTPDIWFQATVNFIPSLDAFSVLVEDISEKKYRENALRLAQQKAEQANQAKSTFVASLSHELRTPLNATLGFVELMQMQPQLTDKMQKFIGRIQSNTHHMLELINDLLDLSKAEANKIEFRPEPFVLPELMENIQESLMPLVEKKNNQLHVEYDNLPEVICQDQRLLRQVLVNLISNAVKYTEQGQIVIRISREPQGWVCCTVADTGVGIDPAFLPHIFDVFSQSESVRARHLQGSGLGLALCQRLVQIMHGDITVKSQLGKGSLFTLKFPLLDLMQPVNVSLS